MKRKLEWPFNLMEAVNNKIDDHEKKLPENAEDAADDLLPAIYYILTNAKTVAETAGKIRGVDAILEYYCEGVSSQEIANRFEVTRSCIFSNIDTMLDVLAKCDLYRNLLKYGLRGHMKNVREEALERGRHLGYIEGHFDGKHEADKKEFERGYIKGYNDGVCGMNNRVETLTRETPIEDCDLSIRAYNILKRAGFDYVEQIIDFSLKDLLSIRNMGRKSADEVMTLITRVRLNEGTES